MYAAFKLSDILKNNSIVLAISDGGKSLTVSLERRLASILLKNTVISIRKH